jgi:phospholipid/cholesterol/gamma-HCH transport system substrate-binding protein
VSQRRELGLTPRLWTLVLIALVAAFVSLTTATFNDSFTAYTPVTVTSDRSGLVMETGAKVKLRGVQVGHVTSVSHSPDAAVIKLDIDSGQTQFIPANVQAQIKASTAFGSKYVDLIYPTNPSGKRLSAGAVVQSDNVTTEANTVFQSLVGVLNQIDPAKLNSVLSAVAQGLRGQGQAIGQATTDAKVVLAALNDRDATIRGDLRSLAGASSAYSSAAADLLATLNAATTTSATLTQHASSLNELLLNAIGFADSGTNLFAPNVDNFVHAVDAALPTTDLLFAYNPEYTCTLVGAQIAHDMAIPAIGGNGRTAILDAGFALGSDPYRFPDNLPIVAAKGGPGGKPGCGSLPDVTKRYPVRGLVTNTGWGTGLDYRPNPGLPHPWWMDFFPATRGVPEPATVRGGGPPAIGPVPYPGAPPYGAPEYGPDGAPLYPPAPGAPAPPPADPADPPPPETAPPGAPTP